MKPRQFAAFLATLALGASAHAAPLLVNASFEANAIAPGAVLTTSITGWTTSNLGAELRNNNFGEAYDGVNFLELDVGANANSWIEQVINTVAGHTYTLSFAYSPFQGNRTPGSNQIQVKWNGAEVGSVSSKGVPQGNNWIEMTYDMVATGTQSTLRFLAVGAADGQGGAIDAISLLEVPPEEKADEPSAVPEPGAPALFGLGLGLLGLSLRRRAK